MSIDTGSICTKCNTELVYSIPPQEHDTTTKKRIDKGWYRCTDCITKDRQEDKERTEIRKAAKKERIAKIKDLAEKKVDTFSRYWRDVSKEGVALVTTNDLGDRIVNLPEHERLMWIYKRHNIRNPESGFQSAEEAEIIRAKEIEAINQAALQQTQEVNTAIVKGGQEAREKGENRLKEIEAWKKMMLKRQVAYVDRLHNLANKDFETKGERMVKRPSYRDPAGNRAARYHLLSDRDTYNERHAFRNRQFANIERIDKLEDEISEKNQKITDYSDPTEAAVSR